MANILGLDQKYTVVAPEIVRHYMDMAEMPSRGAGSIFGRKAEIQIAGRSISSEDLTVYFEVNFDTESESNEAKITIYNLSDNTIGAMKTNSRCTILAGYEGDTGVLFSGLVSDVNTTRAGSDKKTEIKLLDCEDREAKSTFSTTYKKNTKASTIIKDQAAKVGLPIGAIKVANDFAHKKSFTVHTDPMSAIIEEAKLCKAKSYIDQGKLYVVDDEYSRDAGFILSPDTGLLSTPERFDETETSTEKNTGKKGGASKGGRVSSGKQDSAGAKSTANSKTGKGKKTVAGYNIKSLLNHRIQPNVRLQVKSTTANGYFVVRSGKHICNNNQFYTEFEAME